jgi:D-alanyl-D-alanine carboxypeptidase
MKKQTIIWVTFLFVIGVFITNACKEADEVVEPQPNPSEQIEINLKAALDSIIENTHVPGLVAGIWTPDQGVELVYSAGVSNLSTLAPIEAEMIFRIGSNTKTFVVTALLQLVDEGLISLDDYLSDYLPDFPRANEVTIEMLTNMRSGIFNYLESEAIWIEELGNPTKFWTSEELIEYGAINPYYFDPGTGFHYSNTNTIIIGKIIEMITGKSLESEINTRIINPLGLYNTTYIIAGTEIPGYHPCAYYAGEYDPEIPECSEYFDMSWTGAAGCMTSEIFELGKYAKALVEGYYISDSLQARRLNCNETGGSTEMKYGIGIFQNKDFFGHNGGFPGFTSLMVHSEVKNCTIILWYNCQLDEASPTDMLNVLPKLIFPGY